MYLRYIFICSQRYDIVFAFGIFIPRTYQLKKEVLTCWITNNGWSNNNTEKCQLKEKKLGEKKSSNDEKKGNVEIPFLYKPCKVTVEKDSNTI